MGITCGPFLRVSVGGGSPESAKQMVALSPSMSFSMWFEGEVRRIVGTPRK